MLLVFIVFVCVVWASLRHIGHCTLSEGSPRLREACHAERGHATAEGGQHMVEEHCVLAPGSEHVAEWQAVGVCQNSGNNGQGV